MATKNEFEDGDRDLYDVYIPLIGVRRLDPSDSYDMEVLAKQAEDGLLPSLIDKEEELPIKWAAEIRFRQQYDVPSDLHSALAKATRLFAEHAKNTWKAQSIEGDYENFDCWTARVVRKQLTDGNGLALTATELDVCRVALRFALRDENYSYSDDCTNLEPEEIVQLTRPGQKERFEAVEKILGRHDDENAPKHPGRSLMEWFC